MSTNIRNKTWRKQRCSTNLFGHRMDRRRTVTSSHTCPCFSDTDGVAASCFTTFFLPFTALYTPSHHGGATMSFSWTAYKTQLVAVDSSNEAAIERSVNSLGLNQRDWRSSNERRHKISQPVNHQIRRRPARIQVALLCSCSFTRSPVLKRKIWSQKWNHVPLFRYVLQDEKDKKKECWKWLDLLSGKEEASDTEKKRSW